MATGATSRAQGRKGPQDVGGTINLFIVDGQTLLRRALLAAHHQPGFAVVGEAEDVSEAEPLLPLLQPHVVIVNLDSAEIEEGAVGSIVTRTPGARVIGLTSHIDPQAHARTIGAGAAGIVDKRHEPEVLFKAIRKVHAGELWLARYDMAAIVSGLVRLRSEDAHEASKVATLTRRGGRNHRLYCGGAPEPAGGRTPVHQRSHRARPTSAQF